MNAWAINKNRKVAENSTRELTALLAAAVFFCSMLGVNSRANAGEGVIYVSSWQASSFASLGNGFRQSLSLQYKFELAQADSDDAVMQQVAADPKNIGFVQRDNYTRFRQSHAESGERFEFYGDIPACIVAVARKGSSIRGFGDLVRARSDRRITVDVGPATGRVAGTFDILAGMDPALGNVELEHRGGSRALSRVISGETDIAVFLLYAPFAEGLVNDVIKAGTVEPVPFFSESLVIAASEQNLPYTLRQIRLGEPGWLSTGQPYHTTCTSLGVAVNARADARLSEAVARIFLQGDLGDERKSWIGSVGHMLLEAMGEAKDLAVGVREVVTAWLDSATRTGSMLAAGKRASPQLQPATQEGTGPALAVHPAIQRSEGSP